MLTVAVRIPRAVGVNFTTIVQLAFCANELPQLFVSEKSPGLAPTRLMLLMVKLALPVFDMSNALRSTRGADILTREGQARRGETNLAGKARARQGHRLGAAGCIVRDTD